MYLSFLFNVIFFPFLPSRCDLKIDMPLSLVSLFWHAVAVKHKNVKIRNRDVLNFRCFMIFCCWLVFVVIWCLKCFHNNISFQCGEIIQGHEKKIWFIRSEQRKNMKNVWLYLYYCVRWLIISDVWCRFWTAVGWTIVWFENKNRKVCFFSYLCRLLWQLI